MISAAPSKCLLQWAFYTIYHSCHSSRSTIVGFQRSKLWLATTVTLYRHWGHAVGRGDWCLSVAQMKGLARMYIWTPRMDEDVAQAMSNSTSFSTIQQLWTLFAQFGITQTVVTHNGTCFTSEEFRDYGQERHTPHSLFTVPLGV